MKSKDTASRYRTFVFENLVAIPRERVYYLRTCFPLMVDRYVSKYPGKKRCLSLQWDSMESAGTTMPLCTSLVVPVLISTKKKKPKRRQQFSMLLCVSFPILGNVFRVCWYPNHTSYWNSSRNPAVSVITISSGSRGHIMEPLLLPDNKLDSFILDGWVVRF